VNASLVQLADTTQAKHPNDHREQDMITDPDETDFPAADLAERVHHSQNRLRAVLRAQYDLIVRGSGFSWTSRRPGWLRVETCLTVSNLGRDDSSVPAQHGPGAISIAVNSFRWPRKESDA
jgi:hypothetical protein